MRRLITRSRSLCRHALTGCLAFVATAGPALAGTADLDTTFAQAGRSIIPVSSSGGQAFAGALQPDGKLLLGGWAGAMPKGIQIENNAGNPSGITVASSGMSVPGTVFGVYNCTGTVTSRSMTWWSGTSC